MAATTIATSGAVTLAEYAKRSNNAIEQKLIKNIYRTSNILKWLPMADQGVVLSKNVERLDNAGLGSVDWVRLGEAGGVYEAGSTVHGEVASILRNRIEVDHLLLKQVPKPTTDPIDLRMSAWTESLTFELNDTFFNNDPTDGETYAKKWKGLRFRMANKTTEKVHSSVDINGGGTAVRLDSSGTTATAMLFVQKVHELLAAMGQEDGDNCVLFIDGEPYRNFERLVASSGLLRNDKDAYGRRIKMFGETNMQIVNTGYKQDRTTRILPITESATGVADGSATFTSVFIVNFNRFKAWKFGSFAPIWSGIDRSSGYIWKAYFEFGCGLSPETNDAFGRIYNIEA